MIRKYDQGHDGKTVYEDYEKGLQALLEAYSPPDHEGFVLAQQDTTGLTQAQLILLLLDAHPGLPCVLYASFCC